MKLSGWIAMGDHGEYWIADISKHFLEKHVVKAKEGNTQIVWQDPVRCTITIPHDGEEVTK